ncbi:hypothetical protein Tco_0474067 [Tanacetum coccineum]
MHPCGGGKVVMMMVTVRVVSAVPRWGRRGDDGGSGGLVMEREVAAGVGGVVMAAVIEAAVEVAVGCGSGGWRQICGWWDGGV